MKRASSKIREEIGRLQEQLKQAEMREAERIGRLALKAGLGEMGIEDVALIALFEEVATRFRNEGTISGRQTRPQISHQAPSFTSGEA